MIFEKELTKIKEKIKKETGKEIVNYFDIADYLAVCYIQSKYGNEDEYFKAVRHYHLTLDLSELLIHRNSANNCLQEFNYKETKKILNGVENIVKNTKFKIINLWNEGKIDKEIKGLENSDSLLEVIPELKANLLKDIRILFGDYSITKSDKVRKFINLK